MTRRDWLRCAGGVLAAPAFAAEGVPSHPNELRFGKLDFEPPKAEDYRHELPGGAVAYLVEDHQLPLVKVSATVRVGGYLVPRESWGLASFTGSQMRAGGTETVSARDFDEEAAFLATEIASGIGDTSGSANLDCLARNLDRSLAMFFDMLKSPGFDEQRFQLAAAQSLQAMERRNDETQSIVSREYQRLMRGDHFSAWPTTKASIESLTTERMREFHARYFHPSNLIFAVAGDFDSKAMIARLGEALADGWPAENKPEIPPVPAPDQRPTPGVYMAPKGGVNQSQIRLGHLGIERSNPDHLAVGVMNDILGGGGFTSRIMSRVRSDEGLAYSAASSFRPGVYYPGTFTAAFQSQNPKCAEAATIVLEEIRRMREERVTEEELDTSKNSSIEIFPRFFATAGQIAGTFAADEYTDREKDYWAKYRDRIQAVTADKVQEVAAKYLRPEDLVILGVGEVDEMLAGNPDRPRYSFAELAGEREIERIPLPDPLTMEYPA